ncbi:anti-restriction protein [Prochlorococcus phage P-TIM68]|uniref:Putative anti-restriction protein n=1 Tax=Prochlorococcus phage P-TIM68 TaxID=1542477 RepID=A0A0K0KVT5_9CAUD|nr:anti-restriction protein [Prochlorococcus phage P-TIM68]AIR93606.1 putative anti-restriction protein [Prochlorococcus phage P-TIM68]
MTRQGLPTGQMQEETKELLDEYNEEYCWEYNDMVDFIKEYGEKNFRDYYEDYYRAVDDLGEDIVNAFIEVFYIESIGNIEESYQGQMTGAEFAEQLAVDCGMVSTGISWVEIDWKASWDNLSYDYCEQDGYIFSQNF